MLNILTSLFKNLDAQHIDYAVYKGLSHLDDDLAGTGGDVDLLVTPAQLAAFTQAAHASGLKQSSHACGPYYYLGIDDETHKTALLDVVDRIYMGPKNSLHYSASIDLAAAAKERRGAVSVFDTHEYIITLIVMGLVRGSVKDAAFREMKDSIKTVNPDASSIYQRFFKGLLVDWNVLVEDLSAAQNWQSFQNKYGALLLPQCDVDGQRRLKHTLRGLYRITDALRRRVLKAPRYRLRRRGFLVAFVGVDGAGKSSAVDYIAALDFYKRSGVKAMYFGNNAYWIPFLGRLLQRHSKTPALKYVLFALSQMDKQLRIIGALFYMWSGNIVLADRYFYDQHIAEKYLQPPKTRKTVKSYIGYLIKPRMWKKPDVSIFLDVSPEVAYERKQDYSFEKMLEVNKAYKDYMHAVDGVKIVDADQTVDGVRRDVIRLIKEHDSQCA